ncbi:methylcrotonoyl-CoA carboxylase beta chain, mitochondrial-like [Sycon ciliatum]|uniref:methylcrotonoyl-CoA carboxylase beta chain, mitochondrial-like n=1 Tax=Sycon ciliatum TaxID=27933 RepID=UPI0020AA1EFA|eukprot:scpid29723/ scgid35067/ Methylcrotonoyl-CoA carboxylase beta chain, mitochondrial; 3-methylcrotonyl-CoA carboxylase 2; 3-methylcrotonyl-CoA carboxylase non-biotin-containing subunit; 3-methylcrotonyl-CoA:carbon dioxide ligase subunit beta
MFSAARKSPVPCVQCAGRCLRFPRRSRDGIRFASTFPRISSALDTPPPLSSQQQTLLDSLHSARSVAFAGGGATAIHRHTEINKKVLPRERLRMLLDPDSPFLELSITAGHELEYGSVPCGGSISVIGRVSGTLCLLSVTEATVKGGSVYPISLQKQLRVQQIALKNRIPIVYLTDSAGAFLPLQSQIFVPGGATFYNQALLSSKGIPQLVVVCGHCTAGAAYIPSMADEAIIIKGIGAVFLAGPPLLKAATGEIVGTEELGGADVHCRLSGGTDHYVETEEEAYSIARQSVVAFNCLPSPHPQAGSGSEPCAPAASLSSYMPVEGGPVNMSQILAGVLDGSRLRKFKALYGPTLITGFGHIAGRLVGVLANNGPMSSDAALKGAHFAQICSTRGIPMVFLQHTEQAVGSASHDTDRDWMRAIAKLVSIVSCAKVAKICVIIGDSCGMVGSAMCGPGLDADFVFSWPSARIAAMDAEGGYTTTDEGEIRSPCQQAELFSRCGDKASAIHCSARLLDDGIITPEETREVLRQSLEACMEYRSTQAPKPDTGVIRM